MIYDSAINNNFKYTTRPKWFSHNENTIQDCRLLPPLMQHMSKWPTPSTDSERPKLVNSVLYMYITLQPAHWTYGKQSALWPEIMIFWHPSSFLIVPFDFDPSSSSLTEFETIGQPTRVVLSKQNFSQHAPSEVFSPWKYFLVHHDGLCMHGPKNKMHP